MYNTHYFRAGKVPYPSWFYLSQSKVSKSLNKHLLRVYYEPDTVPGAGDTAMGDRKYPCPCGAYFLVGTVLALLQNCASFAVVPLITDDRKKGDSAWAEYKE